MKNVQRKNLGTMERSASVRDEPSDSTDPLERERLALVADGGVAGKLDDSATSREWHDDDGVSGTGSQGRPQSWLVGPGASTKGGGNAASCGGCGSGEAQKGIVDAEVCACICAGRPVNAQRCGHHGAWACCCQCAFDE